MRATGRSGLNSILRLLPEPVRVCASITSLLGETSIPSNAARAKGSYGGPAQPGFERPEDQISHLGQQCLNRIRAASESQD